MVNRLWIFPVALAATFTLSCDYPWRASESVTAAGTAIPVEVVKQDGRYILLRGGQPYTVKGAGIDQNNIRGFATHGGNSLRNWEVADTRDGLRILDEAAKHGLTVAMCLSIGRERLGFDYDDASAVARQLEAARNEVLRYKDHPALLLWIIGNEPDLEFTNPKVFDAINEISRMIHKVDGNHPTTTALASSFTRELAGMVEGRAPDLDIISLQKYKDIVNVPRYIEEAGIDQPYLITEWGPHGHWEVEKTAWGAPLEPNSSEKAAQYLDHHAEVIASNPGQIIGSYVFFWGQKQERTPTWYGMFLADGSETETIDAMHYVWNGTWPENRSPRLESMLLDARTSDQDVVLEAGAAFHARVAVVDPDGDALQYRWEIMRESKSRQVGGDREQVPDLVSGLIENPEFDSVNLVAPGEAGAYRLFVYVYDGQGHAGYANIPFLVN